MIRHHQRYVHPYLNWIKVKGQNVDYLDRPLLLKVVLVQNRSLNMTVKFMRGESRLVRDLLTLTVSEMLFRSVIFLWSHHLLLLRRYCLKLDFLDSILESPKHLQYNIFCLGYLSWLNSRCINMHFIPGDCSYMIYLLLWLRPRFRS